MARQLSLALALLACALGLPCAHADVYTWVDASGNVNVSNLTPPEDARITSVIPTLQKTAAQVEADREAVRRAEILALNERISRLQEEVEQSRRQPPSVSYVYAAPPAPPQFSSWTPPDVSYAMDAPPPWSIDCSWPNYCGGGWGAWGYPAPIVVIGGGDFRRGGLHRGDRPNGPRPPGHSRPMAVTHRS